MDGTAAVDSLRPTPQNQLWGPGVKSGMEIIRTSIRAALRTDLSSLGVKPTEKGPVGTAYLKHSIVREAGAPRLGEET